MIWTKPATGGLRTTPWKRKEAGGIYIGHDRSVWMYRELPLAPLQHEDPARRLEIGQLLETVLVEVGARSRDVGQGISMLSQNRAVHLFGVTFDIATAPPEGTPEALAEVMSELLQPLTAAKALLVGVKLRSSVLTAAATASGGVTAKVKALLTPVGDDDTLLDVFAEDFHDLDAIFRRNQAVIPRPAALSQLEAWFNRGTTPDAVVEFTSTGFRVPGVGAYDIYAAMEFPQHMRAPFAQWVLDAMCHPSPAVAVSIRADLEPHTVTRARLRRQRRKLIAQEEEEAATGDLGREENSSTLRAAEDIESYVVSSRTPWLTNTSVLFAHPIDGADETFATALAATYDLKCEVLRHRQLEALDEMQPTSATRINPFPQDFNPAMLAYSGLPGFSALGDTTGVWVGNVDPDFTPCFLDPLAAAKQNTPPVLGVFGDPGSGKTFAAQLIAGQAAIAGLNAFFVNPKGFDSLAPWVHWVMDHGVPGRVISMSKVEEQGGAFDPFTFCTDPKIAAEILGRHILTVLGPALTPIQQFTLSEGLTRGAEAGARCAMEALAHVTDPAIVELVKGAARSHSLFRLGFSHVPRNDWDQVTGLTLIEFDRELPLPKPGTENPEIAERTGLAALRLTSRAAMEILMRSRGGVYVIDEAHHYISSPEGLASMDRLGREGRSVGLLPVFVTQRPSDLLAVDMESFMSRVLCMKLADAAEARAALTLCRLEPTAERVDFLRTAGPRPRSVTDPGRPALGILRDLYDRHAVITIGPVPEHLRLAMSTNRTDRELREAQSAGQQVATSTEVHQ